MRADAMAIGKTVWNGQDAAAVAATSHGLNPAAPRGLGHPVQPMHWPGPTGCGQVSGATALAVRVTLNMPKVAAWKLYG